MNYIPGNTRYVCLLVNLLMLKLETRSLISTSSLIISHHQYLHACILHIPSFCYLRKVYYAVLLGYPPKEISTYEPSTTLLSLSIRTGDTLTLEDNAMAMASGPSTKKRRLENNDGNEVLESVMEKTFLSEGGGLCTPQRKTNIQLFL